MTAADTRGALGEIIAVTYSAPDLSAVESAYGEFLGYRALDRRRVTASEALSWGAPRAEGRPLLELGPASGEPVTLRFVESPEATGWRALSTFGWNVTEFVVQDVDALAERLQTGPFTIIGPPKGLTRFPMIRAMQVTGPFGECCYFTEVGEGSGLDLAAARSFVGRVFIVVASGPDADAMFTPYRLFRNAVDAPVSTPVKVISDAFGLAPETLHAHGLVRLPSGTMIELDAYPEAARVRGGDPDELPPGMACVTFSVADLQGLPVIGPPGKFRIGGEDAECACMRGAAGELIELAAARFDEVERRG